MKVSVQFLLLALAIVVGGCSATVPIRTLEQAQNAISVSVGGPFIELGNATIPLPYVAVGYNHGLTNDLTVGGDLHLIPAALGDCILDASALYCLRKQDDLPEVTASIQLGLMTDLRLLRNFRIIPTIGLNASQEFGDHIIGFIGFDNTVQVADPSYIVSPYLGARYKFSDRFAVTLEGKWMAANINTSHGIFEGVGALGGHGGIAALVGLEFGL